MTLPVWDWQFLIVSAIALGALLILGRQFLPARRGSDGQPSAKPSGCAHCASNAENPAAAARPAARTVMTQVVSLDDLRDTARQVKH